MISYTVTTQKTQNNCAVSYSSSKNQTWQIYNIEQEGVEESDATSTFAFNFSAEADETVVENFSSNGFTNSNGGSSHSSSGSMSQDLSDNEFTWWAANTYTESATTDSNFAATVKGGRTNKFFPPDNPGGIIDENNFSYENFTTLTPTTISIATTTTDTRIFPVNTTESRQDWVTFGTTTESTEGTVTKSIPTTTRELADLIIGVRLAQEVTITKITSITTDTELVINTENSDSEKWETTWPPRDTATVFREFQNECVWLPTATELDGPGPWALTAVAASHTTDVTAPPFYSSTPLKVVDRSLATLPETPEDPETVTESYTTSTTDGSVTRTIWTTNSDSAFPLESRETVYPKSTTTTGENTYTTFTENNSDLTKSVTETGTRFTNSAEIKDFGLTFQNFFEFSYTTTRYAATWSETYSTQYNGPSVETYEEDNTTKSLFYTNITVNSAEGVTIEGTNVEQIHILAFFPGAVLHVETSFTQGWGLYGNEAALPKAKIAFPGDLSLRSSDFAEILPGLSVPYPTTYSCTTGDSTLSASLVGNAITVTTSSGTTADSSTYEFSGSQSAHTEQRTGRPFFLNSAGLPALSFFGPHAATESIETRARPGELVSIAQDSLGDFTLQTITNETTSAATISKNVVVFPGEKSFYTTTAGVPYLTFSRNPIP